MNELSGIRKKRPTLRKTETATSPEKISLFFGLKRVLPYTLATRPPVLAPAVARPRSSLCRRRNPFTINALRSILARLRKGENIFSRAPRFAVPKMGNLCFQQYRAVAFSTMLAFSLTLGHAAAQAPSEPAQQLAATAPESPAQAQGKGESAAQGEKAPTPSPVTGDALNGYLRALAEAQSARANALQVQAEALRAQQALQQAVAVAQQAQGVLSALVSARAKESGAADGWRLGLDGVWAPPADPQSAAQATQ